MIFKPHKVTNILPFLIIFVSGMAILSKYTELACRLPESAGGGTRITL